jgi:hypothetical protein
LAAAASAARRRPQADLVLAACLVPAAALAMGWLLAARWPGLAVLPPLLVLVLGFLFGRTLPFAVTAAGSVASAALPLLAGGTGAGHGLRAALLAAAVMLALALRSPLPRPAVLRRNRGAAPRLGGAVPPRHLAAPGLMLRAERRADGGLGLALGLAAPLPEGVRVRVAPM